MADIQHLRKMSGAGMMDCKKALEEANGDQEKAMEIIRAKGQLLAAKRQDRDAAEGCVLAATNEGFAAIVAVKCETDFVAQNGDFVAMTKDILNTALAQKPANAEALLELSIDGASVKEVIVNRSGITGEKMELGAYEFVSGESVVAYIHPGNKLATIVAFNQPNVDAQVGKDVAMQIAAMSPVSVSREEVPAHLVEEEYRVAVEKTKEEQIHKAVEAALKKAGINPNLVDSEDHISSNIAKGWLTQEEADKARVVAKEAAEAKAANMPQAMIENIANGRVNKFYKESVLLEQEFVKDAKQTIKQYLQSASKDLTVTAFKRFTLNAE